MHWVQCKAMYPNDYIKQCSVSAMSQQTETSSTHKVVDENDYCAYSKTRSIRMAACDRAKPTESIPKASDTFTAKAAAPTICKSTRIVCPKSSVSNLAA